ncbi:hypothetical protein [Natrialba swarupiae]|uniref:Thioredoxin domain-containing protein n=1 Tax=Natrialba swarupiae TaxID=2448032 RepID=A0A5D5ANM6_9EURY|nr:hypothetical protein [Natrialba swarupiae]TYT62613.1 hypothetical protein FYC77_07550 [Natrialba swarupiae]
MQHNVVLKRAAKADVLARSTGDTFQLSNAFENTISEYEEKIRKLDECSVDQVENLTGRELPFLTNVRDIDRGVLAEFCAIAEQIEPPSDVIRLTTILDQFRQPPPPNDGLTPEFLPIRGNRLPLVLQCYEQTVVYIWRRDCKPCDSVASTFDDIFSSSPDDILLVGVYGPNWVEFLRDNYDVVGAPTTLFAAGNNIHSRLIGNQYKSSVEKEMEKLMSDSR